MAKLELPPTKTLVPPDLDTLYVATSFRDVKRSHIDYLKHMNNGVHPAFFQWARSKYSEEMFGMSARKIAKHYEVLPSLTQAIVTFDRQVRLGETVEMNTGAWITEEEDIGFAQSMHRNGRLVGSMVSRVVMIGRGGRKVDVPPDIILSINYANQNPGTERLILSSQ